MSGVSLLDLRATHNPHRWHFAVTPEVCAGSPDRLFLFGGVALAAAIEALERTCARPVIWATAQYLSFARPGSIIDLDVRVPAEGRQTSQAHVLEHIDDEQIITVNAALGARESDLHDQWIAMPQVPGPQMCSQVFIWNRRPYGIFKRFETRVAQGRFNDGTPVIGRGADGRLRFWIRSIDRFPTDRALLAVAADYVSAGLSNALGQRAGGNSLDNTIRFICTQPTEWILCDVQIESVCHGVAHGTMHLFAENGVLMATASQSLILRLFTEPPQTPDA